MLHLGDLVCLKVTTECCLISSIESSGRDLTPFSITTMKSTLGMEIGVLAKHRHLFKEDMLIGDSERLITSLLSHSSNLLGDNHLVRVV